jgi:hypothetical protein
VVKKGEVDRSHLLTLQLPENLQGAGTVKLSPSQVAIAKKLGVPLEEYAKYVKD